MEVRDLLPRRDRFGREGPPVRILLSYTAGAGQPVLLVDLTLLVDGRPSRASRGWLCRSAMAPPSLNHIDAQN